MTRFDGVSEDLRPPSPWLVSSVRRQRLRRGRLLGLRRIGTAFTGTPAVLSLHATATCVERRAPGRSRSCRESTRSFRRGTRVADGHHRLPSDAIAITASSITAVAANVRVAHTAPVRAAVAPDDDDSSNCTEFPYLLQRFCNDNNNKKN